MKAAFIAVVACVLGLMPHSADSASHLPRLSSANLGPKIDIAVDSVNGAPVAFDAVVTGIGRGTPIEIEGWAADPRKRSAATGVLALVDGRIPVDATYGAATPQIAARLHNGRYGSVGYRLHVLTSNLAFGPHRISFYVLAQDRKTYYPTDPVVNVLLVAPAVVRPIVIGDGRHIVGSLDQVTTVDKAFAYGTEVEPVWLDKTATLFLRGWAVDVIHRLEVVHYYVTIDGKRHAVVHPGDLRPELINDFPILSKVAAAYAGYTAIIPLTQFPTGMHHLALIAIDPKTGEHVPLLKEFPFTTYSARRLGKLVEPGWGPSRPLKFKNNERFAGSIDLITTQTRYGDYSRQALPVRVDPSDSLRLSGWGLDVRDGTSLWPTYAIIDGRTRFALKLGELRPDIAHRYPALPNSISAHAGFSGSIRMRSFATGVHHVTLAAVDPGSHAETILVPKFPFTVL